MVGVQPTVMLMPINTPSLSVIGIALILIGVLILTVGALRSDNVEFRGGGVIFLGPIPIPLGTDKKMILFSLAVGIVVMAATYLFWFR